MASDCDLPKPIPSNFACSASRRRSSRSRGRSGCAGTDSVAGTWPSRSVPSPPPRCPPTGHQMCKPQRPSARPFAAADRGRGDGGASLPARSLDLAPRLQAGQHLPRREAECVPRRHGLCKGRGARRERPPEVQVAHAVHAGAIRTTRPPSTGIRPPCGPAISLRCHTGTAPTGTWIRACSAAATLLARRSPTALRWASRCSSS